MTADRNPNRAETQRALIEALLDPKVYPHGVSTVRHIETHISHVLLTGALVYKIKKPVDLGFLDFSTLARRKYYCDEEWRLNRRLSPDLYRAVVPITGSLQHPRIGGDGIALEYAVQMREFPQSALFEAMLDAGALTPRHVDALARALATFHAIAPRAAADTPYGRAEAVSATIRGNAEQLAALAGSAAPTGPLAAVRSWLDAVLEPLRDRFEARRSAGQVRELHGDLHLGNIAWVDGRVQMFDCIEFDPALRWLDVVDELSFCVMDLEACGSPRYAWRLLNAYLEETGDYAGLLLFQCYRVHRALVRAKVARLQAHSRADNDAPGAIPARHHRYLDLAARATRPAAPALILMHGLSGSGKTVVGQALLEALPAVRIRADVERHRIAGRHSAPASAPGIGVGAYSESMTRATYAMVREAVGYALDGGYHAIADATCLKRWQRGLLIGAARARGLQWWIIDCRAPLPELRARISDRLERGDDSSEATHAVLDWQLASAEPLDESERGRVIALDTSAMDPTAAVALVRERIAMTEKGAQAR